MNIEISIVDPLSDSSWDRLIMVNSDALFFHTSSWALILHQTYGFRPFYLIEKQRNEITGALPLIEVKDIWGGKKAVSLPFSDFCSPLCQTTTTFQTLFSAGKELAIKRGWKTIELRGGQQFLPNEPIWSTCFTHDIDLNKSEKDLLSGLRDSAKRNIRKAEKEGVSVHHETTAESMRDFFRLNCLTRRQHGLPPQPKVFFDNLFSLVIASKNGFISLARIGGRAIAADIFVLTGRKALYKYGAADRRYQLLRPSNILIWKSILQCKLMGATSLNLGRTEPRHEGLLQFKRGLGCLENKINYYRYDTLTGSFKSSPERHINGISNRICKIMPIPILRLLGTYAYQYVG